MKIAIINYGLGNLHSVQKAITAAGGRALVTDDPQEILAAEKVVLPGVGSFADGIRGLESRGLTGPIKQAAASGIPLLGICLGMQLFFDSSEEQGSHQGLGLISGQVKLFQDPGLKIPQIGWNQLQMTAESPLLSGLKPGNYVYFNHSYYCDPEDPAAIIATADYGGPFTAAVQKRNLFGVQFHPEKSQRVGLQMIKNFVEFQHE